MTTLTAISAMPQVTTSRFREVQFATQWHARHYSELSLAKSQAWDMYGDAIDNNESKEQIETLGTIAEMFENMAACAWRNWQDAKRDYLALQN